jgi:glycerol-3-phosphate acyltransferase PlsX
MKKAFKKPWNLLGALFSIGVFKKLKQTFDYKKYSAAIIIGVNKTCIKTHGNADEEQFLAAIRTAYNCNESNVIESIKKIK